MSKLLYLLILIFSLNSFAEESQPYIKLGDARTKKSLLAFPPLQFQGSVAATPNFNSVGSDLFNIITNDLTVSGYFQFVPQSAYVEDPTHTGIRPIPADPKGFKFQSWSSIGAEFLIRGAFTLAGPDVNLEIYLYNVGKSELVLGKKYRGTVSAARRIAHTFSNDVMKALTGKDGMFLSKIVAASDRGGGQFREIYIMDWDAANPLKVSNHFSLALSPTWSPDGKKIAYTATVQRARTRLRNHDMFVYELASGRRSLVSFHQGLNTGAFFAPDSNHLFLTISDGSRPDIYKINLDGTIAARITNGPAGAMNVEPAVSPDGTKIAYSSDRSGRPMIYVANIDGSNPVRKTFAGQFNSSPAWSPDGKKIAFAGQEADHFDIFVMNAADGSEMIRLTKAPRPNGKMANNEDPSFSPDGRFVMYTSNRTGTNQIFFSTVDGSEERRVTNDKANYYKARWSPNLE
jgi:TolB protein